MAKPTSVWQTIRMLPRALGMTPKGIRSSLVKASVLMSVVPLVILMLVASWFAFPHVREFWHLETWFPVITNATDVSWWLIGVIMLTIVVSLLGSLYLTMKIIEPVVQITHEAQRLADGSYDFELPAARADELGVLAHSLNRLTSRIRDNMVELKQFGERTSALNRDIRDRVLILSGLIQLGELISNGTPVDVVLDLTVEKLAGLDPQGFGVLCLQPLEGLSMTLRRAHGVDVTLLDDAVCQSTSLLIDAQHPPDAAFQALWERLGRPNLLLQPVIVRSRPLGVLGIGSRRSSQWWDREVVELSVVFAKQVAIALENELLLQQMRALSIRDELTGVYTESYLHQRLAEELKRAVLYQRPCALLMCGIQGLQEYRQRHGEPAAERILRKVARVLQESVTDIDRVARFQGVELAVLLPERNKREATELSEAIRQRVASAFSSSEDPRDRLTVLVGVAENPLDGVTAEALLEKASSAIRHVMSVSP